MTNFLGNKVCRVCKVEKTLNDFCKKQNQKDGRNSMCKACGSAYSIEYRNKNIEKCRAYDRERGSRQPPGNSRKYRAKYPNKYKAQTIAGNVVRDGKISKQPCAVCGSVGRINAHHNDYLKPLEIVWLCSAHHSQWHAKTVRQKMGRKKRGNEKHRRWIASLPCAVSGLEGSTQAAHIRSGANGGMGLKPTDNYCIPLCWAEHHIQHSEGERKYWGDKLERAKELANALYVKTGDTEYALKLLERFRHD